LLAKKIQQPISNNDYPITLSTSAKRALYDNLNQNEELAIAIDHAVLTNKKDGFRGNKIKEKEIRLAIKRILGDEQLTENIFELVKRQSDY
jgi:type I restriction enzyme R subunit